MKFIIAILALIAAGGCVSQVGGVGLSVRASADPPQVFQSQATTLFVDIDNPGKEIYNVVFEVFDTGIMKILSGPETQTVRENTQSASFREVTVRPGDVLWRIVRREYGFSRTDYRKIADKVNEVVDYNIGRYPLLRIDNRQYGVTDDPGTLEVCEDSVPCDQIRGDILQAGWVLRLPIEASDSQHLSEIGVCRKSFPKLDPKEFQTFSCQLAAGEVKESITNTISAKTTFSAELDAVQLIEMISKDEYERRKAADTFTTAPRKYTYSDGRLALDIEFSEDIPVIERSNKRYFMHLTIRNVGGGFVGDIEPGDFIVVQGTDVKPPLAGINEIQIKGIRIEGANNFLTLNADNLVKCDRLSQKLSPIGDKFPRITCELLPPDNIDVIGNYPMAIKILYDYETRQSIGIRIIK